MKTKKYYRVKTSTRNLVIAAFLIFIALVSANAQSLKGGIVLGVTSGDVKIDRSFTNVMSGKNIMGAEAGFFLKAKLGPVFVKPELLYEFRTGTVQTPSDQTYSFENPEQSVTFNMHNLEVPVLFGLHLLGPLYAEGGPMYNYVIAVTQNYNSNIVDLNRNAFGYRIGGGLDLGALSLHVHYQGMTYGEGNNGASFQDPRRMIFGLNFALGVKEKRAKPVQ